MPASLPDSLPPWSPANRPLRRWLARLLPRLLTALTLGAKAARADRYRKTFTADLHGRLLLWFALGTPTSLNQFYAGLEEAPGQLQAVGLAGDRVPVSRSQFAASHTTRPADFLAILATVLLEDARQHGPRRALPPDLLAIDGTFLRLSLKLAAWLPTPSPSESCGARLQVAYRPAQWLPEHLVLTSQRVNDRLGFDALTADPTVLAGQTIVLDLGYYSHVRLARIQAEGGHFVSRRHATATLVVEEQFPIQGHFAEVERGRIRVTAEARVTVGSPENRASVVLPNLRLVTATVLPTAPAARRGQAAVTYELLTDRWDLSAEEVVQAYLWRWQIELFFRWLKHHLALLHPLGYSQNALLVTIWVCLIRHGLILLATAVLGQQRPSPSVSAHLRATALGLALVRLAPPEVVTQRPLPGWEAVFDP